LSAGGLAHRVQEGGFVPLEHARHDFVLAFEKSVNRPGRIVRAVGNLLNRGAQTFVGQYLFDGVQDMGARDFAQVFAPHQFESRPWGTIACRRPPAHGEPLFTRLNGSSSKSNADLPRSTAARAAPTSLSN